MKPFLLLICLVLILFPALVLAQDATGPQPTGFEQVCARPLSLGACIVNIYRLSLGLGAVVALFMTILAGYRYMNAAGSSEQVESAKESFTYAITGLIILFVAYALLYTINPDLVKFRKVGDIGKLSGIVFQAPAGGGGPPIVTTQPKGGGQPPVIILGGGNLGIREMDSRNLAVIANDPDGDKLIYNWVLENDQTGKAKLSSALNSATLGVEQGSPGTNNPTSIFEGKQIVVRVDVSDGANTVPIKWNITVKGYNRPPVAAIEGYLGTPQKRLLTGESIAPNAEKSYDPDGTPVDFQWGLGQAMGGSYKGTVVCTGCNGPRPGFSIPDMTASINQEVFVEMKDGLHKIRAKVTAYLAAR